MLFEQNEYNSMDYAIYKDKNNLIGFVGNCCFPFDIETLEKWIPIKIGHHIPKTKDNLFGLDCENEWIGCNYPLDTPIKKIIKDLKSTIDVIVAMTFAQASGTADYDSEE